MSNRNEIAVLSSIYQSRVALAAQAGISFDGARNLFDILGYEKDPTFASYWWRYKRTSFGKRLITIFPRNCWRNFPIIKEDDTPETSAFEKEVMDFMKKFRVPTYLRKVDTLAGIGRYGILFLGTNASDHSLPITGSEKLLYLRAFTENSAEVASYDEREGSERYGLPETYRITFTTKNIGTFTGTTKTVAGSDVTEGVNTIAKTVHHSRVIHVPSDDTDEDEINGAPRLEDVLNDLQGLDFILGGSAEMFWRGAYTGPVVEAREGNELPSDPAKRKIMEDEIFDYTHGLKRFMKLQGAEAKTLPSTLESPKEFFDIHLSAICIAKNIPKRILEGSERGELASSEDRNNWADRISDRQTEYCEPLVFRPFLDRCIQLGFLSQPEAGDYSVVWPSIQTPSGDQTAKIGKETAEALNSFFQGNAEEAFPLAIFLQKYLQFTSEEIVKLEGYWKKRADLLKEMEDVIEDEETIPDDAPSIRRDDDL